jgi:hypothetical protein
MRPLCVGLHCEWAISAINEACHSVAVECKAGGMSDVQPAEQMPLRSGGAWCRCSQRSFCMHSCWLSRLRASIQPIHLSFIMCCGHKQASNCVVPFPYAQPGTQEQIYHHHACSAAATCRQFLPDWTNNLLRALPDALPNDAYIKCTQQAAARGTRFDAQLLACRLS